MITPEVKLITKKVKMNFQGDIAHTTLIVEEFRKELEENWDLKYDYPISMSVQDDTLYVTFMTVKKREEGKIGFGR